MQHIKGRLSELLSHPPSLGFIVVLVVFCVPLFVGLGRWDLHNDEAIYSYAVDRMVETGDWLTPRAIPFDNPFLEKPPLKFWLVSGAMRAGLLPKNEFGLRFLDALFGSIAFLYVYALGVRVIATSNGYASTYDPEHTNTSSSTSLSVTSLSAVTPVLCGFVSVLTLFTIDPLLFEHGLRSNNMEAALILSYCGGIYHFARWAGALDSHSRIRHALLVSTFFVLGFMTKFVAALFFPLICVAALATRRDRWRYIHDLRHEWIGPAILVVTAIAPWFAYESWRRGRMLWEVMFGEHVFTRFTGALDVTHLNPWHFYFTQTWTQLAAAGSAWIALAGVIFLAVRAWQGRPWLARLLLFWWLVPFVLMSFGTSKLFHYAYPFLPPIAIGVGFITASIFQAIDSRAASIPEWFNTNRSLALMWLRRGLLIAGTLAFIVSAWGFTKGKVFWEIGHTTIFSNSSPVRAAAAGAALMLLVGRPRAVIRGVAILGLLQVASWSAYWPRVNRTETVDHPLRTLRDCTIAVQSSNQAAGKGVYNAASQFAFHSYNYYFGRIGPWPMLEHPDQEELRKRLFMPGHQTPVILSTEDYSRALSMAASSATSGQASGATSAGASVGTSVNAVSADLNIVILTPGPYAPCASAAVAAGARSVNSVSNGGHSD